MAQIHELSVNLSNQIAAGEVIERPASVVKELVENAIDAGSSRIRIDFIDAGLKQIVVQDNGSGIPSNQIDLAFTRHATSKIKSEHDLFNVSTLGFRGEALASIAAVSHVEILTNSSGAIGTRAEFSAGVKKMQEDAAARQGTQITVKDLFYNTPARLKYLRSPRTEIMKTVDIVNRLALGYPEIAFTLMNEGRILLRTAGNNNLRQTVSSVYGRNIAERMLPFKGSDNDFEVSGLISKPELTRSTRNFISILLNGRYIRNFKLASAVMAGYGNNLTDKHYPIAVIKIKTDPLLVDVNVHPTKREVRLSKETELSRLITSAISSVLLKNDVKSDALSNLHSSKEDTLVDQLKFNLNKNVVETKRPNAGIAEINEQPPAEIKHIQHSQYVNLDIPRDDEHYLITATWDDNVVKQCSLTPFTSKNTNNEIISSGDEVLAASLAELSFVGQTPMFIIAANNDDLYLIDQVAARRLLSFQKIMRELSSSKINQQGLLSPLILEFGNLDFLQIKEKMADIKKIGIFLEDFGQDTFILRSYPTWLKQNIEHSIRKILDLFLNVDQSNSRNLIKRIAADQAQREVSGRKKLTAADCGAILTNLRQIADPYHDAKGNLVIVRIRQSDLRKMFKRNK
ncbi:MULTISPECIES: DNA mismatch repair endonuclease MutL [unclassified Lactobacillus]|uniref:DNA mismatch repair endonuclease MutL n=1 Tax=unclassified Lactobacillus TaxID=2620435 RepID=UPI0018DE26B6|nr:MULTISPECIES: DNA mismatch repair endonuclease MutL [unclassified Lactobacillus]MBH9989873.1 DNA mismatch repair endonuclease MutL [Lactobacillus sp. M0392]MBI0024081.1 DNA mismatch repair endonuclease MutL [Lactobacillus sp. W8171]MBI0044914.1 DNA mismatch repair endonuclease MutL [Lactobacillus sp. M0393]